MNRPFSLVGRRAMVYLATALSVLVGAAIPAQAVGSQTAAGPGRHSAVARHPGMTWVVRVQRAHGVVNVGADAQTNAYQGDTPARRYLPILCLRVDNSPIPKGVTPDFYNGWARGWVALTPPIRGTKLTSWKAANKICAANFGRGWRIAEHHSGWYGDPPQPSHWHFWARGVVPSQTRFWVAINDQPANPWN